jgi:hypothetical protein
MAVRTDQGEDIQQPVVSRAMAGPEKDRRYIYNGEPSRAAGAYALRPNRRGTRRKVSTFNIIVLLFGLGLAIVLYVNNIIVINRLSGDIGRLQAHYNDVQNQNATLAAEVNKKAAWERISTVAGEEIGLRHPAEPPGWIEVDQEKLDALQGH